MTGNDLGEGSRPLNLCDSSLRRQAGAEPPRERAFLPLEGPPLGSCSHIANGSHAVCALQQPRNLRGRRAGGVWRQPRVTALALQGGGEGRGRASAIPPACLPPRPCPRGWHPVLHCSRPQPPPFQRAPHWATPHPPPRPLLRRDRSGAGKGGPAPRLRFAPAWSKTGAAPQAAPSMATIPNAS